MNEAIKGVNKLVKWTLIVLTILAVVFFFFDANFYLFFDWLKNIFISIFEWVWNLIKTLGNWLASFPFFQWVLGPFNP